VCDLLDPLYENTKQEIFGDIIAEHKPQKKKTGPALSTMKREQLIEECQKNNLDDTGKVAELRDRIKAFRQRQNSVDDLFKNYEQSMSKDE
jgi:DNA polymerase delta subunit 1